MAETVDIIREYSKHFILYPINEKMDKMEKQFLERFQELENLIENNKQKTGESDAAIETLQQNHIKLEGKSDFIHETNEKKLKEIESRFNDIKLNKNLNGIEKKFQLLNEIQFKKFSKITEVNISQNFQKTLTGAIGQLELEMKKKNLENRKSLIDEVVKLRKVENETKKTIETLNKDIKEKYDKCMQRIQRSEILNKKLSEKITNDEIAKFNLTKTMEDIGQLQVKVETASKTIEAVKSHEINPLKLKKIEDETKKAIESFVKDIKEKYEKCIEGIHHNEDQLKTISKTNEITIKKFLNKTNEDIRLLQSKVEASKAIKKNNPDEIRQLKKNEVETKKTIDTLRKDINDKYDEYIQRLQQNEIQIKTISEKNETNERIFKNDLNKMINNIEELQSKVKEATKLETYVKDIKEKYEKCIECLQHNDDKLETISETNEMIVKNSLNKTTDDIALLQSKVQSTSKAIEKIHSDEIGQLKKNEVETKKTIETLSKDMKEKYDECIQHNEIQIKTISEQNENNQTILKNDLSKTIEEMTIDTLSRDMKEKYDECIQHRKRSEMQTKKILVYEENENNETILKNDLSKTIENIAQLQLEFQTASREIEEIKSDKIKPLEELRKVENEIKQTIETVYNDIKDKHDQCIQRHLHNEDQLKTISVKNETNERIFKDDLSKTINDFDQLQSKVKEATEAIEEIKSDEIKPLNQLTTKVDVIEGKVKQINFNNELEKVSNLVIK
ncbi:hypothetical protein CHUAL_000085 [Chamberlinius hualienensis]